jgi:type II secretory pathway pseudopilin PulG
MVKKIISREQGFTVVEVLIGIGIFALVMPSIIIGIVSVARLNDRSADLNRANIIAEKKVEEIRNAGFNSLTNGTIIFTQELDASFTEPRYAAYTISSPKVGVKEISIKIEYMDNSNVKELFYKSLISELGVAQ